jgi:hypothetical protein
MGAGRGKEHLEVVMVEIKGGDGVHVCYVAYFAGNDFVILGRRVRRLFFRPKQQNGY